MTALHSFIKQQLWKGEGHQNKSYSSWGDFWGVAQQFAFGFYSHYVIYYSVIFIQLHVSGIG